MREITADSIMRTWDRLSSRMSERRAQMLALEPYRHLLLQEMQEDIWRDSAKDIPRWTLPSVYIAATTDTVVSFLTGKNPVFSVVPIDPTLNPNQRASNKIERAMSGFFTEINGARSVPIQIEVAESAVHRGHIVGRYIKLSQEEMGLELRDTAPVYNAVDDEVLTGQVVEEYGDFPVEVEIYDPLDCAWALGRRGETSVFVHRTELFADALLDVFPGIEEHPSFADIEDTPDALITVYDYWDTTTHAIVVRGDFYLEPEEHGYHSCPVIVELVRPVKVRRAGRGYSVAEGQPFCGGILESVRGLSWAQSMTASNLDEVGMATLVLRGVDPQPNRSPYWKQGRNGKPVFKMVVEVGPNSRIVPTFGSEDLNYLNPPNLAPIYQEFRIDRMRDIQMQTFAESLLSGAQMVELSGYAYNQIKQAAISRVVPPRLAMDRWFSRCFTGIVQCIADDWDFGGSNFFVRLDNGKAEEVRLEELELIRWVDVKIQPEIPTDLERELQVWFQARAVNAISTERLMGKLPDGGVQDPDLEMARIAFETQMMTNPEIQMQLSRYYMRRNNISPAATPQDPASAMAPMGASPSIPVGQPLTGPAPLGGLPQAGMGSPATQLSVPQEAGGGSPLPGAIPPEIRQLLPPDMQAMSDEQLMADPRFMQFLQQLQAEMGGGQPGGPPGGMTVM